MINRQVSEAYERYLSRCLPQLPLGDEVALAVEAMTDRCKLDKLIRHAILSKLAKLTYFDMYPRMHTSHVTYDDLVQSSLVYFLWAFGYFRPRPETRIMATFRTGIILHQLEIANRYRTPMWTKDFARSIAVHSSVYEDQPVGPVCPASCCQSPRDTIDDQIDLDRIKSCIPQLHMVDGARRVMDRTIAGADRSEIGREMGVSRQRIDQLYKIGVAKIRQRLALEVK